MAKASPRRPASARRPATAATAAGKTASRKATAVVTPEPAPSEPARRPLTLRIAVGLLAAEALALGVLSIVMLTENSQTVQGAVGVIGYVVSVAAVVGVLAFMLNRRQAWARSAAIVVHMLMVPFGLAFITGGSSPVGVPVLLLGLVGGALLLAPATRVAVGRG